MPTLGRRDFLKLVGAGGVGGGLGFLYGVSTQQPSRILLAQPVMPEDYSRGVATWYNTICRQCEAGCGMMVRTREGRAKKIEGNPAHPVNQGRLCPRGQAGVHVLYNPDRLTAPLVQRGERGSNGFEAVGWDEALDRVAEELSAARGEAGAGGVYLLSGTLRGHLDRLFASFVQRVGGRYLQHEFDHPASLHVANRRCFGIDRLPYYDIGNADFLVSFGADYLGTWLSPVQYKRGYGHMRRGRPGRRGRFVQVEPRMSVSGANADEWLPARAGSEGLMALAMARHLLARGAYTGADGEAWDEALAPFTAERAAEASGIDAGRIVRLADAFIDAPNALALGGGAAANSVNGVANLVAINVLNYLAGNIGAEGGILLNPPPALGEGGAEPATFEALERLAEEARAGRVGALIVHETNPVFTTPQAAGLAEALREIPLIVAIGNFRDETAELADVILPTHSWLERWGDDAPQPGVGFPMASIGQPVVTPLYDTRSPGDIVLEVARRIGEELPWRDSREHLRESWREIYRAHESGADADGFEAFWEAALESGVWGLSNAEAEQRVAPLAPALLQELELDPRGGEDGEYEYALHPYLSPALHDGRGANLPWLQELPDPLTAIVYGTAVELNRETADRLEVREGDVVEVSSPHGSLRAPALIYPAIRPDTVAIAIGQGHTSYGRYASGRGVNPLAILSPEKNEAGGLAWAATRVRLRATGERARLIRNSGEPRELGRHILG